MINLFGKSKEEKADNAAEHRLMSFQREQATTNTALGDAADDSLQMSYHNDKSDLIRWQQDLDDDLMKVVARLRGLMLVNDEWIPNSKIEPIVNELFVNEVVIPQCEPYISRNMINTNFTSKDINVMLINTFNEIANNMGDGYDIYGITFMKYDAVLRPMKNFCKSSAFRALNGWTKKTDSSIIKRVEAYTDGNAQPTKKLFGIFGGG